MSPPWRSFHLQMPMTMSSAILMPNVNIRKFVYSEGAGLCEP
jgi:hypothetical protein